MHLPGLVRPLADGSVAHQGDLFVAPLSCPHVAMSHQLVQRVMHDVRPGRALILGAGACRELPLVALAERFASVVLRDQDAGDLATAAALVAAPRSVTTEVCDLTGITEALIADTAQRLQLASSPAHATALLIEMVEAAGFRVATPAPV